MQYNPFSLEGKTILVTGASSGIGKSIAIECSKIGAKLIITGRNEIRTQETFEMLEGDGHQQFIGDLTDSGVIKDLVSTLPKLDGLVLAAGIVEMMPVMFASKDKFDKIYNTNLFSPIELLRTIIKKKSFNQPISVVAIDSIAGVTDFCVANGIYGSGKAALKSFLKFFALETANKQIRVNTLSPGMIYTPMHQNGSVDETKLQETVDRIPMKRWGKPEEIAYAAIFLLSSASCYMTGTDITVDGGYTI